MSNYKCIIILKNTMLITKRLELYIYCIYTVYFTVLIYVLCYNTNLYLMLTEKKNLLLQTKLFYLNHSSIFIQNTIHHSNIKFYTVNLWLIYKKYNMKIYHKLISSHQQIKTHFSKRSTLTTVFAHTTKTELSVTENLNRTEAGDGHACGSGFSCGQDFPIR